MRSIRSMEEKGKRILYTVSKGFCMGWLGAFSLTLCIVVGMWAVVGQPKLESPPRMDFSRSLMGRY